MKYILSVLLLLSSMIPGQSYEMTIHLNDGTSVTFSLEEIQKLHFETVTDINDASDMESVIQGFKLLQNYPNPFNPSTTITYELPSNANVILNVYNIEGELVKQLYNGEQNSGVHSVVWNGENRNGSKVSSGVYIYTVRSGEQLLSKQMILLK